MDFRKAFDSINHDAMFKILAAYGIPPTLISAISIIYDDLKARVISPDGESDWFRIHAGVLQGDTLAPYLFIIVLDYVLRNAIEGREEQLGLTLERRRSRRVGPKVATDIDFADDLALLSDLANQAQELLSQLEQAAMEVGLMLNTTKTEVMAFNQPAEVELKSHNGSTIKVVSEFKYLGSYISGTDKDVKVRKALTWAALHKLNVI